MKNFYSILMFCGYCLMLTACYPLRKNMVITYNKKFENRFGLVKEKPFYLISKNDTIFFTYNTNKIDSAVYFIMDTLKRIDKTDSIFLKEEYLIGDTDRNGPYLFKKSGSSIYVRYFNYVEKSFKDYRHYSLIKTDTINSLNLFSTLNYGHSLSKSIYIGQANIIYKKKSIKCYVFKELFNFGLDHPQKYENIIYIDKKKLLPVYWKEIDSENSTTIKSIFVEKIE